MNDPLRIDQLDARNLQKLQKDYPGIKLPVLADYGLTRNDLPSSKVKKARKRVRRPLHVYILIGLSGILAYVCLGLGWLIGAIGDGIYEVGKRVHEAKWRIT